ncbi:MAG: RNA-binding cell elongation regulator Jag/EloR [Bacillota bacterium]
MAGVEKRGRTVDEAVAAALAELGLSWDQAQITVLDEGAKGLFGLMSRDAHVRVEARENLQERAVSLVEDIARCFGLAPRVNAAQAEGTLTLELTGSGVGAMIGRHGQGLDAFQYLVGLAVNRKATERVHVRIDIEGYRRRREETLQRLAQLTAERVRRTGQRVALEPMSAQERRLIHLALKDDPHVSTGSEGEEPYRRVVISTK